MWQNRVMLAGTVHVGKMRFVLTLFDSFMKMQGPEGKCKDEKENARTKRKMQGRHRKLFLGSLRANRAIKNNTIK